jgi:L-alanine-DL-glutamate epimerase-like enolase superfamily enzyme
MRPSRLRFASAPIPFRTSFGHASARRERAENVLVLAEDGEGRLGLGEGCPRRYVTGETAESARAFLGRHREELSRLDGLEALREWIELHAADIDADPSAFCAAELALLDLYSRQRGVPIERLLGIDAPSRALTVSAVYGTGSWVKFGLTALLFALHRMREAKLKLSGDPRLDRRRAALLRRRGPVRLDANNLWATAEEAALGLAGPADHAWAVEEPIAPRDWAGLREVAARTGLDIILDESFTRAGDLAEADSRFIANFRVSKLGGLLRALDALRLALEQGRRVIVGAQVGETSILARAGLALAAAAGDRLVGYEGAYGTRLLTEDAAVPSIGFGRKGLVDPAALPLQRHGLGLSPSPLFEQVLLSSEPCRGS